MIQENFKEAVLEGLVDKETGEILDNRPELWGRKNTGFNKPLKTLWRRRIYGCFKISSDYEFGHLNLNGSRAKNTLVEYFVPCGFVAIDKGMDAGYLTLNQSKFTEFSELDHEIDAYKIINKSMTDYKAKWNELDKAFENTKDSWDGITLLEGYVKPGINVRDNVTILTLCDPSNEEPLDYEAVTCFIPRMWEINFTEWSKIMILGRLRKRKPRSRFGSSLLVEENEDLGYTMNAYGIFTVDARKPTDVREIGRENVKCTWHKKKAK